MTTIYLASGNTHKAAEFGELAKSASLPLEIRSARDLGGMPEVVEDTGTFVGNARKKARALRALAPEGTWVLADDSGLCVDALGGAPGVESAYYAGPGADGRANYEKLLKEMNGVPEHLRGAHFYCLLYAVGPNQEERLFEGKCPGRILFEAKGRHGFGYDPIFGLEDRCCSMAEVEPAVKNTVSHRARAWAQLAEFFRGRAS